MLHDITGALPQVIADHITAYNTSDPDKLLATLAPDALVNDNRREFIGHAAIREWADKEIFGANVTLAIEEAYDQHGDIVARFRVDGDYDKTNLPNPLILTYYFSIRTNLITQLVIVLNTPTTPAA